MIGHLLAGYNGKNLVWLTNRFHLLMGMFLKKVLPFWFKGPIYTELATTNVPYSRVANALRRDMGIMLSLVALTFVGLVTVVKTTVLA